MTPGSRDQGAMSGPVDELANPEYPLDAIDRVRLNQIIRHRVRNVCGGCRMILDVLRTHITDVLDDPVEWDALYREVDDVQQFSRRLDLLIDPLPPAQPLDVVEILAGVRERFVQRFPLCSLEFSGPEEPCELLGGNWLALALDELLANAGRAAGSRGDGSVEVAWTTEAGLQVVVANNGARFPATIPVSPPVPFRSTAPSYDGLGLAIVYRICLALGMTMVVRTDLAEMTAVILSQNPRK